VRNVGEDPVAGVAMVTSYDNQWTEPTTSAIIVENSTGGSIQIIPQNERVLGVWRWCLGGGGGNGVSGRG
jgi:hypothetical protein